VIEYDEFVPMMLDLLGVSKELLTISKYNYDTLSEYFGRLFTLADTNGDGVLELAEVTTLMQLSGFKFDTSTVAQVVEKADINHDGLIDYNEFVPMMLDLLDIPQERFNYQKYDRKTLEEYFYRLFRLADTNNDGVLELGEVTSLLQLSGFKFDPGTITTILEQADTNQDGVLQYEEFIAMMLDLLGIEKKELNIREYDYITLARYFKRLFEIADVNEDGVLQLAEVTTALQLCGFKFNPATMNYFLQTADVNHDGVLQYEEFVPMMLELCGITPNAATMEGPPGAMERLGDTQCELAEAAVQRRLGIRIPIDVALKQAEAAMNSLDFSAALHQYESLLAAAKRHLTQRDGPTLPRLQGSPAHHGHSPRGKDAYRMQEALDEESLEAQSHEYVIKRLKEVEREASAGVAEAQAALRESTAVSQRASFRIWIQTMTGEDYEMEAYEDDSVLHLKQRIEQLAGIDALSQQLLFNGRKMSNFVPMSDESTQVELHKTENVTEGSPTKQMEAYVSTSGAPGSMGTEDQLDAYRVLDAPPEGHVPQTLQYYGIQKFSTVHVVEVPIADVQVSSPKPAKIFDAHRSAGSIPRDYNVGTATSEHTPQGKIYVKTIKPKAISVEVEYDAYMNCGDLKRAVEASHDIAVTAQRMLFAGRDLEDEATIGSTIPVGGTVHLIPRA